jgi:hypothetical protein
MSTIIQKQETLDAWITHNAILSIFPNLKKQTLRWEIQPPYSYFDLALYNESTGASYAIEIKERNKSLAFPTSEMKLSKLERIFKATTGFSYVWYMSLVNKETAYLFDLYTLDWSRIPIFHWTIKKVQYSRSQEMERVEAYDIPWSMASYKTEITKYYEPSPLGNK